MTKKQLADVLTTDNTTIEQVMKNNIKPNPFSLKGTKLLATLIASGAAAHQLENLDQRQLQLMLARRVLKQEVKSKTPPCKHS